MLSHSRLSISRRRVPGPRAASASAAVSTHSRGRPWPRAARTRSLTHLLACHVPDREPFFLQTPVNRSKRHPGPRSCFFLVFVTSFVFEQEGVFVFFAYGSLIVAYLVFLFRAVRCRAVTLGDGFCDSVTWSRNIAGFAGIS